MSEVCSNSVVNRRATIFYSKPKDYLRKEDRDILMEAIIRLNNVWVYLYKSVCSALNAWDFTSGERYFSAELT